MSAASDKYEKDVAANLDKMVKSAFGKSAFAERPSLPTTYSDVRMTVPGKGKVWCEVKMNHTDNLSNTRVFYKNGTWQVSDRAKSRNAAAETCRLLNESKQTKQWVKDLADSCGINYKTIFSNSNKVNVEKQIKISTTTPDTKIPENIKKTTKFLQN